MDEAEDAVLGETLGEVDCFDGRGFGPASDSYEAIARVEADGDVFSVALARLADKLRVCDGDGAEDDTVDAGIDEGGDIVH